MTMSMDNDRLHKLILQCRYYNGEEESTNSEIENDSRFANYERCWVSSCLQDGGCSNIEEEIKYYRLTLKEGDNTPLTLKALLFNRYMHWMGAYQSIEDAVKDFENGFYADYLSRKTNHERIKSHE